MPAPAFPYPSKIEALAQPVADAYAACTDDLLVNIAGRFNVNDLTLGSGEWRFKMLAQMGQLTQENIEIIAKHTGQNTKTVRDAIEQAAYTALDSVEPALKQAAKAGLLSGATSLPMSPRVQRVVENFQRQAVDKMNLVNTTMLESSLKEYQIGVNDVFATAQQTMNQAAAQTVLGTTDRHTAVRQAITKMARDGITGFYDKAGRRWSPEAYVNMDIGTTMHNTYVQSAMARNTDYGNDLVYAGIKQISRPLCYPWQGKVISMNGNSGMTTDLNDNPIRIYPVGETTYGEPAGLWGINCGHSCNVFIPALSVIRGEVPDKKENDREYATTQAQRQLERNVRYAKRDAAMAKATGDKEAFEQAAAKVRRTEKDLRDFYDNTGRSPSLNRTRVVGYNKSVAGSVTQAAKREERYREFASGFLISSPNRTSASQYRDYIKSVHSGAASLSESDQKILDALPKRYMWVQVRPEEASIYSLAALTAKTGDEFAMFAKGDTKIVIRGNTGGWTIPKDLSRKVFDEQLRWAGHSHPTTVNLAASDDDRKTLSLFTWQKKSTVIDLNGNTVDFTPNLVKDTWEKR